MKRWHAAPSLLALIALALLLVPQDAGARPAYASKEKRTCSFCHVGRPADRTFTPAGEYYGKNHAFEGYAAASGEAAPAPAAPAVKPRTEAPAQAAVAAAPSAPGASPGGKECPCPCGCKECAKKGAMHGPMMMGGMKEHLAESRKGMTALRDHEKAMEGVTEPEAFRKEVLKQLRMIDDYLEMHLKRMESMAGRMEEMRKGDHPAGE